PVGLAAATGAGWADAGWADAGGAAAGRCGASPRRGGGEGGRIGPSRGARSPTPRSAAPRPPDTGPRSGTCDDGVTGRLGSHTSIGSYSRWQAPTTDVVANRIAIACGRQPRHPRMAAILAADPSQGQILK